jgi:hypothetical protein
MVWLLFLVTELLVSKIYLPTQFHSSYVPDKVQNVQKAITQQLRKEGMVTILMYRTSTHSDISTYKI